MTTEVTVCDRCKRSKETGMFWVKYVETEKVAAVVKGDWTTEELKKKHGDNVKIYDICSLNCLLEVMDLFIDRR